MATVNEVLKTAKEEIGTKESPVNSNKVKYNTWYYGKEVSGSAYPWCMAFIMWLFNQTGMKLPYKTASCSALLNWYKKNRPKSVFNAPMAGDIVIYNFGHTGIVESIGNGSITAIEGNTSPGTAGSQSNGGMVCRRTRKTSLVTAYIRPDYDKEDENDMVDFSKWTDADFVNFSHKMQAALKKQAVSSALSKEFSEAKSLGITDGTAPCAFATRAQAAVMDLRSLKKDNK